MSKSSITPRFTVTLTAEEEHTLLHGTETERVTLYRLKRAEAPAGPGRPDPGDVEGPGDEAMRTSLYVGLVALCVGLVTVFTLAASVTATASGRLAFAVPPSVATAAIAFYLGTVWAGTAVALRSRAE